MLTRSANLMHDHTAHVHKLSPVSSLKFLLLAFGPCALLKTHTRADVSAHRHIYTPTYMCDQ